MDDLLKSLSNITTLVKNEEPTSSGRNDDASYRARLELYQTLGNSTEKCIDPKIQKQRETLPIFKRKDEFLQALRENQILIVIGETGSGKTTQIPQYIVEAGYAITGKVGCTQLRRMAAKAVAKRVASEFGTKLGHEVGYTIRFEDKTTPSTKIQYMTDGILIRECTYDRSLSSFSAIILDESHERTIDTDVLLAVLKQIAGRRNDLKLIVSSATIDGFKFSKYFYDAKVFQISGRMFPVDIVYVQHYITENNYVSEAVNTVIKINEREEQGDILIFMSGEDDIEDAASRLEDYRPSSLYPSLTIIPVYAALPWETQALIFDKAERGCRKVVIATNIAETSLTVDGIRYVIDSGFVKQKVYDSRRNVDLLTRVRVSQAQAIQRTGRAGRIGPGKCYRLYTLLEFTKMNKAPEPEIGRSNLTNAVLLLKKMGYVDIFNIDFLDSPPRETIQEAIDELRLYQAIDERGEITEIGHKMAGFPLEPNLAKMVIISEKLGCSEEILTIVSMLSVGNIFYRRKKQRQAADRAKSLFFSQYGDLVMLLEVFKRWTLNNCEKKWCYEHFINARLLEQAFHIKEQLKEVLNKRNMKLKSSSPDMVPVMKSICSGFFQNLAQKQYSTFVTRNHYKYKTIPQMQETFIHPGSSLFKIVPQWVVYQRIVHTSKPFMRDVTPVSVEWLKEFTPAYDKLIPSSDIDMVSDLEKFMERVKQLS